MFFIFEELAWFLILMEILTEAFIGRGREGGGGIRHQIRHSKEIPLDATT